MYCKHYNGDGYHYTFNGEEIWLCEDCERELLGEMKKQEVIENKLQKMSNISLQNQIYELKGKMGFILDKYETCCYECGKERYGDKHLKDGITLHIGVCPFCEEEKTLIPAYDWAGYGD